MERIESNSVMQLSYCLVLGLLSTWGSTFDALSNWNHFFKESHKAYRTMGVTAPNFHLSPWESEAPSLASALYTDSFFPFS